jgi:hypothetical protein
MQIFAHRFEHKLVKTGGILSTNLEKKWNDSFGVDWGVDWGLG